jgi:general secretion pathway protein E/type IV pilus assembly protein PilB
MSQPIGQRLLSSGMLSEDQLRIALLEQEKQRQPIGKLLVSLGFISEATLRDALAENLGTASIDLRHLIVSPDALSCLPRAMAQRYRALPLAFSPSERQLTIAVSDSNDLRNLDRIRALFNEPIELDLRIAGESEIERAIDRHYGHELSIDGILREIETGEVDRLAPGTRSDDYSQPVVRLIDALLTDAVKRGASDIHFEPEACFLRIRYRIDGLLRQIRALHKSYWPAMSVRLKVLSGMNIAESRAPQDGHIGMHIAGQPIDFRSASQPTLHGENIVLRILDRHKGIVPLAQLGLSESQLQLLHSIIARPAGIILVTGPTGSGKTTTLYSILNHLNHEHLNIMTLEDPVEYPLPLIRQTSVTECAKLDFANGIRSTMRQDPDIILVGEIRDRDTAEMAFRAALTGHQVYSTLHTNSALGALPRLLDIGVQPGIMAGNINGIIAQRLVRRLCNACKQPYRPAPEETQGLALGDAPIYQATGCPKCDFQGYAGRLAIMEILHLDETLDGLIGNQANWQSISRIAEQHGFTRLATDGLRLVRDGQTSLAELRRVIDLSPRC